MKGGIPSKHTSSPGGPSYLPAWTASALEELRGGEGTSIKAGRGTTGGVQCCVICLTCLLAIVGGGGGGRLTISVCHVKHNQKELALAASDTGRCLFLLSFGRSGYY